MKICTYRCTRAQRAPRDHTTSPLELPWFINFKGLALLIGFAVAPPALGDAGWQRLPNTKLVNACPSPSPGGAGGCAAVISAWGGAAARTKPGREQLILWGGGHGDYYGNEVYALNLNQASPTLTRLTDPSIVDLNGGDAFKSDSRPVSRHTYGGLAYLPGPDRLFAFEGARMPNGTGGGYTWTLDLGVQPPRWQSMAGLPESSVTGASCAYDPNSDAVFCNWGNLFKLVKYSFTSNAWTQATQRNDSVVSYTATAVIDPKRRKMYFFGGVDPLNPGNMAIRSIDISSGSNFATTDITSQTQHTCDGLGNADFPGLAYDTKLDRIVGWPNSGNTVYIFDPATNLCTSATFPNGPPGVSTAGTFGRFAYFPSLDAFAVVTAADEDVYLLRLSSESLKSSAVMDGHRSLTYSCIDVDGDGYGVGPGCLGPDADDSDIAIHTGAQAIARYGSLTAFLAYLGYAPGRIWYLATNGNDKTGTINDVTKPYATYGAVRTLVKPGDAIVMRDKWNGCVDPPSGTAGAPVLIMSYPGELAVLDGVNGGCLKTIDRSWLIVDGVKTMGAANISGGTTDGSPTSKFHDNVFRHMETVGGGSQGLGGIAAFNGLVNITVELNVLHDIGKGGQHCLYLGSRGLPSSNIKISRNLCYNAPWNGFHLNGRMTGMLVEQNVVHSAGIAAISLQEGISNSTFRGNVIANFHSTGIEISNYPGNCAQFGQGGTGQICPYDQIGNVFENNTIYATDHDWETGEAVTSMAVQVVNYSINKVGNLGHNTWRGNIFVGLGQKNHYPPVVYRDVEKDYLKTSTFENNVFWSLDGSTAAIGFGPYTNSYGWQPYSCAQAAAVTNISGCINADPMFVDASPTYWSTPTKLDLRLKDGSPAAGRGAHANATGPTPTPPPPSTPPTTPAPGSTSTPSPPILGGGPESDSSEYNYGGMWWNAPANSESGWGVNLAHQGDVIFAVWFTYDSEGKPWWFCMTAYRTGDYTFSGALYETRGPALSSIPFEPSDVSTGEIGQGTLTFMGGNEASLTYVVNGVSQSKTLTRLIFGTAAPTCVFGATTNLSATSNYQDIWWASPPGAEAGWGIGIVHQDDTLFATWFTYDSNGRPVWFSVTASNSVTGVYEGILYYTTGPAYNSATFDAEQVMYYQVGSATFTFLNGNDAIFSYTLNGFSQSKPITRQIFRAPGTVCH